MNIIFGRENATAIEDKYIVLELDTITYDNDKEVTAFCAVENIPIIQMPKVEQMKKLHENLLENYRNQNWNFCNQALEHLTGFWNQELDTFYLSLSQRISDQAKTNDENWDWKIKR